MKDRTVFICISWMTVLSFFISFISSAIRHELFNSVALDLGIFDQAVYLISQGQPPISSLIGFHILADHAAFMWYPIAILYKIYPTVYWLFAVQAIAISLSILMLWLLCRQAGLTATKSIAITTTYSLYPLLFNINLSDFYLDVIIPSALFSAVWSARAGKTLWFCLSIILVLGCKSVFALTIIAMGVWLIFCEKSRLYGLIAIISGISWFIIATQIIIPFFGGSVALIERHISRYSHLGNSFSDIARNLFLHPELFLTSLFSLDNIFYLFLLFIPVIWGLSISSMTPLIGAIPCLVINLLADSLQQKDVFFHYSLPILPFIYLAVIQTHVSGRKWVRSQRIIILWSLVTFFALAKYGYFWSKYLDFTDTQSPMRAAISLVKTEGSVYTTAEITPHLTHRKFIKFTHADEPPKDLNQFDYILLNFRNPGWLSNKIFVGDLIKQLINNKDFKINYQKNDVYLFSKNNINVRSNAKISKIS